MQLILARQRQQAVIDHWRRAHALNPAVIPLGGITARQVIEGQLQLQAAQYAMVGVLAQVVGQLCSLDVVMGIGNVDVHFIQQQLTLRHMLGRGT